MVTTPDEVGESERGITEEDKFAANILEKLIDGKLNTRHKGKNLYEFLVSNMERVQERVLRIVENRYKKVWGDAKISEEPRTYQDTPGVDPYYYRIRLVKDRYDQDVIEYLEGEIDKELKVKNGEEKGFSIKLMPFPRKVNESVIREIEEKYGKESGKWDAKMVLDAPHPSQYAPTYTLSFTPK